MLLSVLLLLFFSLGAQLLDFDRECAVALCDGLCYTIGHSTAGEHTHRETILGKA